MQVAPHSRFAAFIGIDWADEEHAVAVYQADAQHCEVTTLDQNSQSLEAWAANLRSRFNGESVAICIEQSRGGLVYALMRFEFLVLFPINPKQLARYREAVTPSGAKDDPGDAVLLADFLRQHHTQMRSWCPDDALTRSLKILSEARRQKVNVRTSLGQRLRQQLKEFFPLVLELLDGQPIHSSWFLRLLLRFSTFAALRRASPRQLERLAPQRRRQFTTDDVQQQHSWIQLIRNARPLVTDEAVILGGKLEVETLVSQIQTLNEAVARYDVELAESLPRHPDAALFRSVPGAGNSLTPRLIGAFGTDRERFESAAAIQEYSGIAPVTKRSGRSCTVRRRRACSKFLRQTFHELADHSRLFSPWAEAYYRMLRARDKRHHACIRALAFKWIRILFRCWQERVPYSEEKYIKRLEQTHSPILAYMAKKT